MAIINYKLVLLIESFSAKELEQFRKFISSPFYSKGRNYTPFLENVLELKDKTKEDEIDNNLRTEISGKQLSYQTLKNRYSELYKLGEEFLVTIWLSENKFEKGKIKLKKLIEKKLLAPYRINYRETLNNLNLEKFSPDKLRNLADLKEINSKYLLEKNKEDILYDERYEYSTLVFCSYLINCYKLGFDFLQQESDNRVYKPNYIKVLLKNLNIESIISDFRNSDNILFKIIAMNFYLYKANIDEKNEGDYYTSHNLLIEISEYINKEYKISCFTNMINYCIKKLNKGNVKYRYELFDLYNEKLSQNLTDDLRNKSYTFNHFRDYVFIAISVKKFDWLENFIEKYSGFLPPEIRNDEIKISYAKLYFEKKRFKKSLLNLNGIKVSHYLQYIDTSLIKLCNYYELKEFEYAYLEIDKLKHYFRNKKNIPKTLFLNTMNFIKIYRKLIIIQIDPEKIDTGYVEKEIKSMKLISRKSWLMEKIEELK